MAVPQTTPGGAVNFSTRSRRSPLSSQLPQRLCRRMVSSIEILEGHDVDLDHQLIEAFVADPAAPCLLELVTDLCRRPEVCRPRTT
jgi:hypothetical protein